jgi:hypothetical protein
VIDQILIEAGTLLIRLVEYYEKTIKVFTQISISLPYKAILDFIEIVSYIFHNIFGYTSFLPDKLQFHNNCVSGELELFTGELYSEL